MRSRISLAWSDEKGYHVDLPQYTMIPGTWLPLTANLIHADGVYPKVKPADALALNPTVEVEVMNRYADLDADTISLAKIRALHKDHAIFDHEDYRVPPHQKPR